MSPSLLQMIFAAGEFTLLFAGAGLGLWLVINPHQRARWLLNNQLRHWPVSFTEFVLFGLLLFLVGLLLQSLFHSLLGPWIRNSTDQSGLEMIFYGAGFHGGVLLGCLTFPALRRRVMATHGIDPPPPAKPGPVLPWPRVLRYASGALLVALPLLTVISLGWTGLLRIWGLPDEPQDLIEIFNQTNSFAVIGGLLLVACVVAPISEELIFRAGLYRYVRQQLGRMPALLLSGILFGALHGNWAGFLPLAVLGILLALAYEATGSIRVSMLTHALFNLNTVIIVFSGLPELSP